MGFLGTFGHIAKGALFGFPVVNDSYHAYREHRSVPGEFVKSTIANLWPLVITAGMKGPLAGAAQLGLQMLPAIPMLAVGINGTVQARNSYLRQARTPFSHSFEHTEASHLAMQRGLESINGARTLIGAEAGALAGRYGRR